MALPSAFHPKHWLLVFQTLPRAFLVMSFQGLSNCFPSNLFRFSFYFFLLFIFLLYFVQEFQLSSSNSCYRLIFPTVTLLSLSIVLCSWHPSIRSAPTCDSTVTCKSILGSKDLALFFSLTFSSGIRLHSALFGSLEGNLFYKTRLAFSERSW